MRNPAMTLSVMAVCSFISASDYAEAKWAEQTRDGDRWLVAKQRSGEDWLVTYDASRGTVSGSVLQADGSPVLIDCDVTQVLAEEFVLSCHSAGDAGWEFLTTTELSRAFLQWPNDPAIVHVPPPVPTPFPNPDPAPTETSPPGTPGSPRLWLIGETEGPSEEVVLMRSDDAGETWKRLRTFHLSGGDETLYVGELLFVDDLNGWLVLTPPDDAANAQLWKTFDGGDTWTEASANLPRPPGTEGLVLRIGGVGFADPQRGFVPMYFEVGSDAHAVIAYTGDGGHSWRIGLEIRPGAPEWSYAFYNACMTPSGRAFTNGVPRPYLYPPLQGPVGLSSGDFGASWEANAITAQCTGGSSVWYTFEAGGSSNGYYSAEAGHGEEVPDPNGAGQISFAAVAGDRHAWVPCARSACPWNASLFATDDRGKSWRKFILPYDHATEYMSRLIAVDEQTLVLTVNVGVEWDAPRRAHITRNGGKDWQELPLPMDLRRTVLTAKQPR